MKDILDHTLQSSLAAWKKTKRFINDYRLKDK